jgi:hypothetical protein
MKGRAALARAVSTADPRAFDAFLKGRYYWRKRPRDSALALDSLRAAVAVDPSFALAHAALADVYNTLGSWEAAAMPGMEAFPKAQDAALAALCIDPHCARRTPRLPIRTMHYLWQWEASGRQFRRALDARSELRARASLVFAPPDGARGSRSFARSDLRALGLDPLDLIINVHWPGTTGWPGSFEHALEQAERTRRLDESDHWVHFFSGLALSGWASRQGRSTRSGARCCSAATVRSWPAALGYA